MLDHVSYNSYGPDPAWVDRAHGNLLGFLVRVHPGGIMTSSRVLEGIREGLCSRNHRTRVDGSMDLSLVGEGICVPCHLTESS